MVLAKIMIIMMKFLAEMGIVLIEIYINILLEFFLNILLHLVSILKLLVVSDLIITTKQINYTIHQD